MTSFVDHTGLQSELPIGEPAVRSALIPVRVITVADWPVAFWEDYRRSTVLGLVRAWQRQAPVAGESGWCLVYEVRVRERGVPRLVLVVGTASCYPQQPSE